jgi:acyl dehydratase
MLKIDDPRKLKDYVGKEMGVSDWVTVDQARIDKFAEATGDFQWIHVDPERAKRELPGGKTIAHGYLTLSLMAGMKTFEVKRSRGLNYGSNKVRFTNQVPAGSRVRLRQTLKSVEETKDGGFRMTMDSVVEIEGQEKPALVAETMGIAYP